MTKEIYVTVDQANQISSSYDQIPEEIFDTVNQYIINASSDGKYGITVPGLNEYVQYFAELLNSMGYSTYPVSYNENTDTAATGLRINWGYYS